MSCEGAELSCPAEGHCTVHCGTTESCSRTSFHAHAFGWSGTVLVSSRPLAIPVEFNSDTVAMLATVLAIHVAFERKISSQPHVPGPGQWWLALDSCANAGFGYPEGCLSYASGLDTVAESKFRNSQNWTSSNQQFPLIQHRNTISEKSIFGTF